MHFSEDMIQKFVVHEFYEEETCFCWNNNKLVIFPYSSEVKESVQVVKAPANIKQIQCYSGRIFITCFPQGVYKLSREREFALLSKSAIGTGSFYYEVLTPSEQYLYLKDKQTMNSKLLFQLSSMEESALSGLCTFPLNARNTDMQLIESMNNSDEPCENVCVIADGKKLYKLVNQTIQIIYNSTYPIMEIVPVQKDRRTAGLLFLTNTDAIVIMHLKEGRLVFEKVCLNTKVQAICASFSQQMRDTVWIVYSDESKLYYAKKQLCSDIFHYKRVQNKSFICLRCYDPNVILGLTVNKQLRELSTDAVEKTLCIENDTFINLRSDMLRGTELIMDQIYKRIQQLQILNRTLESEQNKLRRINLYAHKQKIRACPTMLIRRISNQAYLSVNFHDALPQNSRIILSVTSRGQNIFCAKEVTDFETVMDLHIPEDSDISCFNPNMDLLTFAEVGKPWCLVKNCISDPPYDKNRKRRSRPDKSSFIRAKISMLTNFMATGSTDMYKLSDIKKCIRKEFGDT